MIHFPLIWAQLGAERAQIQQALDKVLKPKPTDAVRESLEFNQGPAFNERGELRKQSPEGQLFDFLRQKVDFSTLKPSREAIGATSMIPGLGALVSATDIGVREATGEDVPLWEYGLEALGPVGDAARMAGPVLGAMAGIKKADPMIDKIRAGQCHRHRGT